MGDLTENEFKNFKYTHIYQSGKQNKQIEITFHDVKYLCTPTEYLNDTVINFYLK
jgi:Ulp1 family protease